MDIDSVTSSQRGSSRGGDDDLDMEMMEEDDEDNRSLGEEEDEEDDDDEDEEEEDIDVEDDIDMKDDDEDEDEDDEDDDDIENTKPLAPKSGLVSSASANAKGKKVDRSLMDMEGDDDDDDDDEEDEFSDDDFSNPQMGMGFGGLMTKRQRSKLDVHDVSLELFELPVGMSCDLFWL